MLIKLFNHFHLTWRLAWDRRVSLWLKLFLILAPLIFALIPTPLDPIPLIGLLDDFAILGLCSYIFSVICPMSIVAEHRRIINRGGGDPGYDLDANRYPSEQRDLAVGFTITLLIIILGGYFAGLIGLLIFGLGYISSRMLRGQALSNAVQITDRQLPHLYRSLENAQAKLPPVSVELFVTQNPRMNAFTFGYSEPYSIILTSGLVERLNEAEIQAVIGHELGHIYFGHVRLISLMSGLGSPARLLFYNWNRACEYSSDSIALLASGGNPEPVVSALLKISSGLTDIAVDLNEFLGQMEGKADKAASAAEFVSTHPFINNRIKNLIKLSGTSTGLRLSGADT